VYARNSSVEVGASSGLDHLAYLVIEVCRISGAVVRCLHQSVLRLHADKFPTTEHTPLASLRTEHTKSVLRLATDRSPNREKSASQSVAGWRSSRRCGGVQSSSVDAAENAGCNVLHRHFDHSVNLAVGRDADNATAGKAAVPEVAFGIDC